MSTRGVTDDMESVEDEVGDETEDETGDETESLEGDLDDGTPATGPTPVALHSLGAAVLRLRREFRRFLRSDSEHAWYHHRRMLGVLAVVLVMAPAVIAYVIASGRPEVYVARGEALFNVEDAFVDEATSETLALIGESDRVLAPVAEEAGLPLRELQKSVTTSVVGTTTVVALEVRRDDPEEAAALAESILDQWVASARRPTTPANAGLSAAIGAQTTRLGEVEAELASSDLSSEDQEELEQDRDDLLAQIDALQSELRSLEGNDFFLGHKAAILAPAQAEPTPVEPKPIQSAVAGGVIGLLLAGAVIALAWQLTQRG